MTYRLIFAAAPFVLSLTAAIGASVPKDDPRMAAHFSGYQIVAVGDAMIGSDYPAEYLDPRVTEGGDPVSIIGSDLAALFKGAITCRQFKHHVFHALPFSVKRLQLTHHA